MRNTLKALSAALILTSAVMSGCAVSQPTAAMTPQAEPTVDMVAHFDVRSASGYQLLATTTAYNLNDIDHVTLSVQKQVSGTWTDVPGFTAKKVARVDLGTALTLSNLRMATDYKIIAKVYSAADEAVAANRIDNAAAADNEITFTTPSLSVAANQVNATTGDSINIDARSITIKAKLKNKVFAGDAKSATGVTVTNGTIVDTTATETF